jgi:hypothetical protein
MHIVWSQAGQFVGLSLPSIGLMNDSPVAVDEDNQMIGVKKSDAVKS